jgi:integrase
MSKVISPNHWHMKRQPIGSVCIEVVDSRLRLRLPRQAIATGTNRYISTGLTENPVNRRKAQTLAWEIEEDIAANSLQAYQTYIDRIKPKTAPPAPAPLTLSDLWLKYCDYKKPQLAETTYQIEYCGKWANHLAALPQSLDKAIEIRDVLMARVSIVTAKRILTMISAASTWAVKSGLITTNPFSGLSADLKRPKSERSINPFSATERDSILLAFQQHPTHNHYHSFVSFLFLTGCRTGEAIALQWKHVTPDLSSITFAQSYSGKLKVTKSTKTGKARRFPVNSDLRELLATIKPTNVKPDDLVFTSPTGHPISNGRFTNRIWRGCKAGETKTCIGIMPSLITAGFVTSYRCPYNTRHTFITMMLAAGLTCSQVATLVGNSPAIILKHYAGGAVDVVPRI